MLNTLVCRHFKYKETKSLLYSFSITKCRIIRILFRAFDYHWNILIETLYIQIFFISVKVIQKNIKIINIIFEFCMQCIRSSNWCYIMLIRRNWCYTMLIRKNWCYIEVKWCYEYVMIMISQNHVIIHAMSWSQ